MYSSGWCAWSIEPGPQTIVGMPAAWIMPRLRARRARSACGCGRRAAAPALRRVSPDRARGPASSASQRRLDRPNAPKRLSRLRATSLREPVEARGDLLRVEARQAAELPVEAAGLGQDVARRAAGDDADMDGGVGRIEAPARVAARHHLVADAVELRDELGRGHDGARAEIGFRGMRLEAVHVVVKVTMLLCASTTSSIVGSPTITASGRGRSWPRRRMVSTTPRHVVSSS